MCLKFKGLDGSQLISFSLIGRIDNDTLPGEFQIEFNKINNVYTYNGEPLETIVNLENSMVKLLQTKCLTFFSHAQKEWINFQAQLEVIFIEMNAVTYFRSLPFAFTLITCV